MMTTPKISHIPVEVLAMGGTGLILGGIGNVNVGLSALALALAALANNLLFQGGNHVLPYVNEKIKSYFKLSPEAFYVGSNAVISTITFLILHQLKLISKRTAGIGIFFTAAIVLSRISILYEQKPAKTFLIAREIPQLLSS